MTLVAPVRTHGGDGVDRITHDVARHTLAVGTLGLALHESGGTLSTVALLWLTVSIAQTWLILGSSGAAAAPMHARLVTGCVALCSSLLFFDEQLGPMTVDARLVLRLLVAGSVVLSVLLTIVRASHRRAVFVLLLATVGAAGLWMLTVTPQPRIDVLLFQREAIPELLRGLNPYAMQFRDPYPPAASAMFYGPGVSVDGILKFGYPYMPLTLFAAMPGFLAGDVRYASLAALLVSGWLIAFARPTRGSVIAATLLLSTPAFPLMLLKGWVETYVILVFAAVWFVRCRAPGLLPYVVGLLFASKQYMIIVVPALLLLLPTPWQLRTASRFLLKALAAGLLVTAPLVLWNLPAFLHSAALLQFRQPFRPDALSYLAWVRPSKPAQWVWVAFAGAAIAWVAILLRHRRRPVSLPLACALVFGVFFSLNKQAFHNYYFLILGCLSCAMAESSGEASPGGETATVTASR